jgi:hypothetical protein
VKWLPVKQLLPVILVIAGIFSLMTPAAATLQLGAEWRLEEEEFALAGARVQWWSGGRWGLRGGYNLAAEYLSAGLLYRIREGLWLTPYAGLGVRDLFDATGVPFKYRVEVIAGLELHTERFLPGFTTALEIGLLPAVLTGSVGEEERSAFRPYVGVSLQYNLARGFYGDNLDLLARLITAEAKGEPYEGQVAVGAVVMNRVKSPQFPNTIREVIYQKGQFSSLPKLPRTVPTESAIRAAREAMAGKDPSKGALFFYNPQLSSIEGLRFFASSGLEVTVRIGNHVFLK